MEKSRKSNLKVGIITALDPDDKRSWSGIYYRMSEALKNEFSLVTHLGPVKLSKINSIQMRLQLLLFKFWHLIRFQKKGKSMQNHIRSKFYGQYFDKRLMDSNVDIIFAPTASIEIAHLKSNIPICYFSDTSFSQIWDYYDSLSNLSLKERKMGNEIEQAAMSKSKTQVFPSHWALDFAKSHYHAKNAFVAKMGANINSDPEIKTKESVKDRSINMLFVGVDWKRKGGDIALETLDKLIHKGYDVKLTVCGCIPPTEHPQMVVIPFLDKNKKEDMLAFQKLFEQADLYFMPTRAECYGIVFCEANAYGLPVISTDTGGVSSIVENGVNGFLLSQEAKSDQYCEVIERLITEDGLLAKMSETALIKYKAELNWSSWGKEMRKILLLTESMSREEGQPKNQ
tara:strand:+ start:6860 stop:8056 length:1197 start_codon:yes stop_codon:yes gene_type:complete